MPMKIKKNEASLKFTYGEKVGIESFLKNSSLRNQMQSATVASFSYSHDTVIGYDTVIVTPTPMHDSVTVRIRNMQKGDEKILVNSTFSAKYRSGKNDAEKIINVLVNVLDILEYRKSIRDVFNDMDVLFS